MPMKQGDMIENIVAYKMYQNKIKKQRFAENNREKADRTGPLSALSACRRSTKML